MKGVPDEPRKQQRAMAFMMKITRQDTFGQLGALRKKPLNTGARGVRLGSERKRRMAPRQMRSRAVPTQSTSKVSDSCRIFFPARFLCNDAALNERDRSIYRCTGKRHWAARRGAC